MPCADGTIDKIILIDAFHHIPEQPKSIQEMKRVLKENGKIIIEEFNPQTIIGKFIVLSENLFRMQSTFYTPGALKGLFTDNGFNVRIIDENKKSYYLVATK